MGCQVANSGKTVQMVLWESDQLIVVMKQGNACGAKGLAGEPRNRDTSSGLRTGQRKSTKLNSMTHSIEGEEVLLKSRMREICTSGSVRGLVVDSERSWPRGLLDSNHTQQSQQSPSNHPVCSIPAAPVKA